MNEAPLFRRFIALLIDIITFFGFVCGGFLLIDDLTVFYPVSELYAGNTIVWRNLIIIVLVGYLFFETLFTRVISSSPGKLCMNADIDFRFGNTFTRSFVRSLVKVFTVVLVIPVFASYLIATSNIDSESIHDRICHSHVTNTTRTPRFIGIALFFVALVLIYFFIIRFQNALHLDIHIDLPEYNGI